MARSLGSLGEASKAIEFYRSAIAIMESSEDVESEYLITLLGELGSLLLREGKVKDAEDPYQRLIMFLLFWMG